MYSRITSYPVLLWIRKHPLAQKCWPTKFLFFSPYTRAKWIADVVFVLPLAVT